MAKMTREEYEKIAQKFDKAHLAYLKAIQLKRPEKELKALLAAQNKAAEACRKALA